MLLDFACFSTFLFPYNNTRQVRFFAHGRLMVAAYCAHRILNSAIQTLPHLEVNLRNTESIHILGYITSYFEVKYDYKNPVNSIITDPMSFFNYNHDETRIVSFIREHHSISVIPSFVYVLTVQGPFFPSIVDEAVLIIQNESYHSL